MGARLALLVVSTLASVALDLFTKWMPHAAEVPNYGRLPIWVLIFIAACLAALGASHSRLVAAGAGLMLGGLIGNDGQILAEGYATDWIPIGNWLTNVADISGAAGLACCCLGYLRPLWKRRGAGYRSDDSPGGLS